MFGNSEKCETFRMCALGAIFGPTSNAHINRIVQDIGLAISGVRFARLPAKRWERSFPAWSGSDFINQIRGLTSTRVCTCSCYLLCIAAASARALSILRTRMNKRSLCWHGENGLKRSSFKREHAKHSSKYLHVLCGNKWLADSTWVSDI